MDRGIARSRVAAMLIAAAAVVVTVVVLAGRAAEPAVPAPARSVDGSPLPGLPLVALPAVRDLVGEANSTAPLLDRLTALAAKAPTRADVQLAIGAEHLKSGDGRGAQAAFERARTLGAAEAEVALQVAAYNPDDRAGSVDRVRRLAEATGATPFARYELAVVELWSGNTTGAARILRAVREAGPEAFYGVKADDLLHPSMVPGYPFFTPSQQAPTASTVATLTASAAARPADVGVRLQLGAALSAAGRRRDALGAFRDAAALDPTSVEAAVAAAVGGFSKDDPARTFGLVGPLVRDHPDDPPPRFHLALMLLWIGDREKAKAEFRQVADAAPASRLGRLAKVFGSG